MPISEAIRTQHLLTFSYDGYQRTVEPHTYGIDRKGREALLAYQVSGGSESGERVGWKIFHERDMSGLAVLPQPFRGSRPGYKREDKAFARIKAQI